MKKKPRTLILTNATKSLPLDYDYSLDIKTKDWQTEAHIIKALEKLDYPFDLLALFDNPSLVIEKIKQFQPDIVFNLVERFANDTSLDPHVAAFLEMLNIPFTGCGPIGLALSKNKGLSKKILSYHHIHVPDFVTLPKNKTIYRPKRIEFPIFIKPLNEEASMGISQSSFVESDEDFISRVSFIHNNMGQDAIAEEYITGRELYVSIMGYKRLKVFPIRELKFREVPTDEPRFASYKAKWDEAYRKKWGIKNEFADPLPSGMVEKIIKLCKKIYRLLSIRGYARMDLRLTPDGKIVFIEANPNPAITDEEDFPESVKKTGLSYAEIIQNIIQSSLKYHSSS